MHTDYELFVLQLQGSPSQSNFSTQFLAINQSISIPGPFRLCVFLHSLYFNFLSSLFSALSRHFSKVTFLNFVHKWPQGIRSCRCQYMHL